MGWVYDGAGFVEANKAQRQAYDKHLQHELIREALSEPYAVPAMIGGALFLTGAVSVAYLSTVFWGPFKENIPDIGDLPGDVATLIVTTLDEAGISADEERRFQSDLKKCMKKHPRNVKPFAGAILGPVAAALPDPFRTPKIIGCMTRRGWAEDVVIEVMAHMVI